VTGSAASLDAAGCPSEDEVLAFAAGRLSLEQRRGLHRHFDACEACQRLLHEAVHALATAQTSGVVGDAPNDELTWSATFRPGTVVGQRYIIRQFIARGGMGEVYEAFDQELQERVALKTVTSTAGDNRAAVRRLKAEVQLARRVSHPNVCRIYDFGTHVAPSTHAPTSFLTMEFVDGETLGQRIRTSGALPMAEARRLGRELLAGLSAAHGAGVLHRDFKSDNVILRREERGVSAVILDFGLARALDRDAAASSMSHRGLVGTLAYIPPEQFDGKPHTTAGDIYSFGVVWFEMLTGELPFKPSSSPSVTTLERLSRPASPPSSSNPLVPPDLDEIVLRCLRRNEAERFQTAAEVLAHLEELESRAQLPRPPRRLARLAVPAVLAAVGTVVALGAYHLSRAPAPSSAAKWLEQPAVSALAAQAAAALIGPDVALTTVPSPASAPPPPVPSARALSKPPTREPKPARKSGAPAISTPSDSVAAPPAPSPAPSRQPGWENPFGSSG
jgi:serine/threonine protein kinase